MEIVLLQRATLLHRHRVPVTRSICATATRSTTAITNALTRRCSTVSTAVRVVAHRVQHNSKISMERAPMDNLVRKHQHNLLHLPVLQVRGNPSRLLATDVRQVGNVYQPTALLRPRHNFHVSHRLQMWACQSLFRMHAVMHQRQRVVDLPLTVPCRVQRPQLLRHLQRERTPLRIH